jgi:crotonobetainyl-CoA:carnitine CoA-transferase CaiB-like acyl-CoA transferase
MTALKGIVVVERAGRLAAAIGATLLSELGATVLRVEDPALPAPPEPDGWRRHPLVLAGKTRIKLSHDAEEAQSQWREIVARTDVLIQSPPLPPTDATPPGLIRCDVSSFGAAGADGLPDDAGEAILQAIGGMMSTTGAENGPPEFIGAPLVEFFTGVNCAAAVAAALRIREAGGPAQRIDLSALDASVALTGAYIGHMQLGKAHDVRAGSRHPLCCPWNAYRTSDGWVLMCSSTEPHWRRITKLIGRMELAENPDFVDTNARQANHAAVDAAIEAWTVGRTTDEAVAAFEGADIPVGPILTIPELLAAPDAPPVRQIALPNGRTQICPAPLVVMSRTPSRAADRVTPSKTDIAPILAPLGRKAPAQPGSNAALPLAGLRVIEIGVFTAGPLGTRYLADLGAEVIKVEQTGGETGRKWTPNFGGVSGYFATYNAGKRSIILDLTQKEDQEALERLVASADVLLQNLKAGALERMGFGPEDTLKRHPRLIYVSVSGYGSKGAKSPALDTVVQARSGLMSLIHAPDAPIKAGASVADLLASHISPLGVLAALRHRDATGEGQHIDVSMRDALAWTTQLSWPDGAPSLPESSRIACSDGWVVTQGPEAAALAALPGATPRDLICADAVARLREAGLVATRVLELDELFKLPLCRARELFLEAASPGGVPAPVLATPYGLTLTRLRPGPSIPGPGADNVLLTSAS